MLCWVDFLASWGLRLLSVCGSVVSSLLWDCKSHHINVYQASGHGKTKDEYQVGGV